jgi:hypothetical protein
MPEKTKCHKMNVPPPITVGVDKTALVNDGL